MVDPLREFHSRIRAVSLHPATQLGFWVHFTSGFSCITFVFMWGVPYLVVGQGMTQAEAGGLFALLSMASMAAGPVVGSLTARHPVRRSSLVMIFVWAVIACWAAVLLWPGRAPLPLLVLLVLALAVAGPGTGVGFDLPRTSLPATRLGAANGLVISGGFLGGTARILLMGLFLDWLSGGSAYTPEQLRLAWLLQIPFFVVGILGIHISRGRLRRQLAEDGVEVSTWRAVARRIRDWRAEAQKRPSGGGGGA